MSTIQDKCPLQPDEKNLIQKTLFRAFMLLCAAHLLEHIAQAIQVYGLGWPVHKAGGVLGLFYPWLAHSELLHYAYALFMFTGLWGLRHHFTGTARWWWMLAWGIQAWHHSEHALLLGQALYGESFFNAPQPISVIQFTGFFNGTPETGFGGLLGMKHFGVCNCEGAAPGTVHKFQWLLLTVRRVEVHLIYNTLVTIPMVMAVIRSFGKKSP